jgi:hypothetical protein
MLSSHRDEREERLMDRNIRGTVYHVDDRDINNAVAMFDLWKDGKGPLKGEMGRQAFLLVTQRIANDIASSQTSTDPFAVRRLTKVLRSVLAQRKGSLPPSM